MQKVTFINAVGEEIELYRSPFFLAKIEGLGDVEADIQTQKAPGQDGSTYLNTILEERYIPIEVEIIKDFHVNRQTISRVFNPKLGPGTLIYENDKFIRRIQAVPEHVPKFNDPRPRLTQNVVIDLVCHNPFWLTEEKAEQMVVWEGGLKFALKLPTFFARQSLNKAKIIDNDGDAEAPIRVTFNGPATSPITIMNKTNGEFITVKQNLLEGDVLEIDTTFGKKSVVKILADGTRQNAFHYITLDSTFLQLQIGNNLIDYTTGADYERAAVNIKWHNRYIGI